MAANPFNLFGSVLGKQPVTSLDIRWAQYVLTPDLKRKVISIDEQIDEALDRLSESLQFVSSFNLALEEQRQKEEIPEKLEEERQKIEEIRDLYRRLQTVIEENYAKLKTVEQEIRDYELLKEITPETESAIVKSMRGIMRKNTWTGILCSLFLGIITGIIASLIAMGIYNHFWSST